MSVCVWERERETRKMDKTGVCLIELNTSKRFALTGSAFRLVSGDFQSSGKGRSHKIGTRLATVRLRVRTRRELLPVTSKTLKNTRLFFVIDHSKQSLCNEQDTRHSHFLSTARMCLGAHSKACVGIAMALPLDTYHFLCGTRRYPNFAHFWAGFMRMFCAIQFLADVLRGCAQMTFLHHQGQLESPKMFNVGQPGARQAEPTAHCQVAPAVQRIAFLRRPSKQFFCAADMVGTNVEAAYSKSGWITEMKNWRRAVGVSWHDHRQSAPILRAIFQYRWFTCSLHESWSSTIISKKPSLHHRFYWRTIACHCRDVSCRSMCDKHCNCFLRGKT